MMYYDIERLREQAIARASEMFSVSNALAAENTYTEIVDTEIVETKIIDEKIVLEKIPQIEPTVFEEMPIIQSRAETPQINIEKVLLLALLYLLYNEKADKQLLLALLYILV